MWDAGMLGCGMCGMLGHGMHKMQDAVAAVAVKFATGFKLH